MGENLLKELGSIVASEIMVKDPLYIGPDEKISTTELLMLRKNIGGLPVVNEQKKLIGIITQRDIRLARFAMSLDSPFTLVKDLMTPDPISIKASATIKEILAKMSEHAVERLPVVNEENELIGLVLPGEILMTLESYLSKP